MLSIRSRISIGQYLALQPRSTLTSFMEKCEIIIPFVGLTSDQDVVQLLKGQSAVQLQMLLTEIMHSTRMFRHNVNPKYLYDERWTDIERCLFLDGYRFVGDYAGGYQVVALDPTIHAAIPIDDDLTRITITSALPSRDEILRLMDNSATDFRRQPPDYNGALTSARVSLETIVKDMVRLWSATVPMTGDASKFGANIAYLQHQVRFLTKEEVDGVTGVYSFASIGAHYPVGFTAEEMVRLGRSLIASVCYFLVKKFNGL